MIRARVAVSRAAINAGAVARPRSASAGNVARSTSSVTAPSAASGSARIRPAYATWMSWTGCRRSRPPPGLGSRHSHRQDPAAPSDRQALGGVPAALQRCDAVTPPVPARPPLRLSPSALVLVAPNLVPPAGVLFFGWSVFATLLLFWVENVIVGAFNVLRMLVAQPQI